MSDANVIISSCDVLGQSITKLEKNLSEILEHRALLISIIEEFEADLKQAYNLEDVTKNSVQTLQQEHLKLVQSLEDVEEYICAYTAKNKTEQRLVTLTVLDIFIRLNNIDQKDGHIKCLIGHIKTL